MEFESITKTPQDDHEGSFDIQFKGLKEISLYGEKVGYVDLVPEVLESEVPVLVAPGWAETPETLKNAIQTFFEAKRRVISVKHGRFVPRTSDEDISPIMSDEERAILSEYHLDAGSSDIPVPELLKAKALLAVLNECHIEKTDVVAHSEGAMNSVIAAMLSTERFRNMILVGPAGLTDKGEDSAMKRTIGGIRSAIQDVKRSFKDPSSKETVVRAGKEALRYMAGSPMAAVEEVGAIAGFNIEEMITKLHERGIKISIVHGTDEAMFPMKGMQRLVESEAIYEFYPMKGHDHHDIYLPKEALFIKDVLESMERSEKDTQ